MLLKPALFRFKATLTVKCRVIEDGVVGGVDKQEVRVYPAGTELKVDSVIRGDKRRGGRDLHVCMTVDGMIVSFSVAERMIDLQP